MSTNIEKKTLQQHQAAALNETKEAYPKYFEALEKHPRVLVGTKVPAASPDEPGQDAEGFVTLRDSADAKEWQEATKQNLVAEIRSKAQTRLEGDGSNLQVIHQSIQLFQNNSDLVPGTRQFDKELADEFASMASAYEVRQDGKLVGYSIGVQPLIDRLRTQMQARRSATPAAPASPAAGAPSTPAAGSAPAPKQDGPQAGVQSKSGSSSEGENYDTLWGTLGMGGVRV